MIDSETLPIAASYKVTEDVARDWASSVKDTYFPRWMQIGLPLVAILQVSAQFIKIGSERGLAPILSFVAVIVAVYGFTFWRGRKKRVQEKLSLIGQEISVRFFADRLEMGEPSQSAVLKYGQIRRVGRDDRGLVILASGFGLFVPTKAFASREHRDLAYSILGAALRKR